MHVSLRSNLAAGVAVAGAAAIAVTPIVQPDVLPSVERVSANVQLAFWANPLDALGDSLKLVVEQLSDPTYSATGFLPYTSDNVVPFPAVRPPIGLFPQLFNGSQLGNYDGTFVPNGEFVSGLPLLSALGTNAAQYLRSVGNVLGTASAAVGALLFGLPLVAADVITDLVNNQPVDIGAIIQATIVSPIVDTVDAVVKSVSYIGQALAANVVGLASALPTRAVYLFATALSGVSYVATRLVGTVTTAIGQLATPETAWNTLVNGLLGPSGTVGDLVKLSFGNGDSNFFSFRQALTLTTVGAAQLIRSNVGPVQPTAAVQPKAAETVPAASERSKVEVSVSEVKAAAAAGDSASGAPEQQSVTDGDDAPGPETSSAAADSPKPATKHRVTRKAAADD